MASTAGDADSKPGYSETLATGSFGQQQQDDPHSRTLVFGSYGREGRQPGGDASESQNDGDPSTGAGAINKEETPAPSDELKGLLRSQEARGGYDMKDLSAEPFIEENEEETNDEESLQRLVWSLRARIDYLEEQEGDPLLPEDTYTFFATTYYMDPDHTCCRPRWAFLIAFGVFLLQGFALTLLAMDIIDIGDRCIFVSDGANFALRASQLVAILLTVICQDLITPSLSVLASGYDQKAQVGHCGFESQMKWNISILLRLLTGLLSLIATFLLVMKSETVRDLLLNFAAVSFVSHVDKIVFKLAVWGYASEGVQDEAMTVKEMRRTEQDTSSWKLCWMVLLFLALFPFWVWLSIRQGRGDCRASAVLVHFSDDFSSALATFSGVYAYRSPRRAFSGDRGSYVLDDLIDEFDGSARFVYCKDSNDWSFQYGESPTSVSSLRPCEAARAQSAMTASYDILDSAMNPWYFKDPSNGRLLPLRPFSMESPKAVVGMKCRKSCDGDNFVCLGGVCACGEGWFGSQCQLEAPCRLMKTDERFDGFDGTRQFGDTYSVVYDLDSLVQSYGRPVYRSNNDIMFFTGRRWQLSTAADLGIDSTTDIVSNVDIAEFMATKFHGYWSNYTVSFVSDPADSASATDLPTPVGFRWHHAELAASNGEVQGPDDTRNDVSAMLLCAVCNGSDNQCYNGGVCDDSGVCRCLNGTSGTLCQVL